MSATAPERALAYSLALRAEFAAKGRLEEVEAWLARFEDQRRILAYEHSEAVAATSEARAAALEEPT